MSLHPSVAAVRRGVRRALVDVGGQPVLVACSGGADSLALVSATVFEARQLPCRVVGVTVDHGLQEGSADHAARVVEQMARMGVDETAAVRVQVEADGRGPEAAAREARYAVLDQLAEHFGSEVVLLGHTRDDQAETVLLGLTRGSGGRSLAGMRGAFDSYRRPLLGVSRDDTVTACQVEGIEFWDDPHNADPRFARARVRHTVLPMLERELGPGVAEALARTADQLHDDLAALDLLSEQALTEHYDEEAGFDVWEIEVLERAIRTRMLRLAALRAGCPPAELFAVHVAALERQVWNRDQLPKEIQLPGHVTAYRVGDHLSFRPTAVES